MAARVDTRRGVAARRQYQPAAQQIYLNPLDHLMAQQGFEMVRYADDFVIMCRSPEEAAEPWPWCKNDGGSRPDVASG